MKIAVLFNHEELHQIPHALPYAYEIKRQRPQTQVEILCGTDRQAEFCETLARRFAGLDIPIRRLRLGPLAEVVARAAKPVYFLRKKLVLKRNFSMLARYDALIAPECASAARLRKMGYAGALIGARHGAGDREGAFNPKWRTLDLVLLPGEKYRRLFRDEGFFWNTEIVGYPKFDLFEVDKPLKKRIFDNDLPTALYTPHFSRALSSFHDFGDALVAHFAARDDWNLIVAPHVVLFSRGLRNRGGRLRRWRGHPRIRIDRGSLASVDMTYLKGADLYIGDVSSQVYEFIARPRPCIFLNAGQDDWRENPHFANWRLGDVLNAPAEIGAAVDRAAERHREIYRERQIAAVRDTFHQIDGRAAERGAQAILRFMDARA